MTDLRKAASSLLEAVVTAIESGDWKVDGACDPHVEIIRLKNILARPEQEPVKEPFNSKSGVKEVFTLDRGCWERGCVAYDERDGDGVNILAERVDETAKREHEPVARVDYDRKGNIAWLYGPVEPDGTLLYIAPPISDYHEGWEEGFKAATREHEPFIYVREDNERPFGGYEHCSEADAGAFPVYTAPPKREWVGLTHEERDEIDQSCRSQMEALFAIEAKLKEKNT